MNKTLILLCLFMFPLICFSKEKRILVLGDSLTEGYGVSKESAFPALLERKFKEDKKSVIVINAGISGSTTASGYSRLKWQLKNKPDYMILALGANDGLRGLPVVETKKNLSDTIELAQENKITVILAGIMAPPNYGEKYTRDFKQIFSDLSNKYKIQLIPFLLEGVAGKPKFNQADGIHPNEEGHKYISEHLFKLIRDKI